MPDLSRIGMWHVLLAAVAVLLLIALLRWAYIAPSRRVRSVRVRMTPAERLTLENELRRTNYEVIGAVLLIAGVVFTYLQLQDARTQLNLNTEVSASDRLVAVIGQVGSEVQAEQVGGMYGLRNLALDEAAKGDHSYYAVLDETLSAFIRYRAPCLAACPPRAETVETQRDYTTIQVALSILGNRDRRLDSNTLATDRRTRSVDLRGVDLRRAQLRDLQLTRFDFRGSNLSNADLTDADVRGADLRGVVLSEVIGRDSINDDETTRWF